MWKRISELHSKRFRTRPLDCAAVTGVIALAVGFGGVGLGALLPRRNERQSHAKGLLTQALNDAVAAIAHVAAGGGSDAQAHYASASARIALHGPREVVEPWRRFQDEGNTNTPRTVVPAWLTPSKPPERPLGHETALDEDLRVLLFGSDRRGTHSPAIRDEK